jgi:phage nucleotide-binding protein
MAKIERVAQAGELVPAKVDVARAKRGRTVVVYSEGGLGKTRCLASLGLLGKTLVIDIDGGQESLAGVAGADNVDVVEARRIEEVDTCYENLGSGKWKYDCLAIDTASEFEKLASMDLAGKRGKEFTSLAEYGDGAQKMREYFRKFKDLASRGMHVVFTAHVRSDKEAEGGGLLVMRARPAFTAGFSKEVIRLVDIQAFMVYDRQEKARYFLLDAGNPAYDAKRRGSVLTDKEPADLAALITKSLS